MQENTNSWIIQVVELVRQSLVEQSKSMPEKSARALVFSSIDYALGQMVQVDLEVAEIFIACLTSNFNYYGTQDKLQVEPASLAQDIVRHLTEAVEHQVEVFRSQNQEFQFESITNIIQASKISEWLIKPLAHKIFAQGEAIVQATEQSQANLVQLYFSAPHPVPPPHQQGEEIENFLEENPVEKLVGFEKHVENFQRRLRDQRSHIILVESDSGTGKSSLLYRLMHICVRQHIFSYIDLKGGLLGVQEIVDKIGRHTGLIESGGSIFDLCRPLWILEKTEPRKKCVLLIDTIEEGIESIPDLGRWFREDLFDLVRPRRLGTTTRQRVRNLIIVAVGRQYVPRLYDPEWTDEYLTTPGDFPLRNWGEYEIRQFVRYLGMKEIGDQFIKIILLVSNMGKPINCYQALMSCHLNPELLTQLADQLGVIHEHN